MNARLVSTMLLSVNIWGNHLLCSSPSLRILDRNLISELPPSVFRDLPYLETV